MKTYDIKMEWVSSYSGKVTHTEEWEITLKDESSMALERLIECLNGDEIKVTYSVR